jgi:hypothetical protein
MPEQIALLADFEDREDKECMLEAFRKAVLEDTKKKRQIYLYARDALQEFVEKIYDGHF